MTGPAASPGRDLPDPSEPQTFHATCVAAHGCGLLVLGASGSGKSTLGLAMLALGARLVADDRVVLVARGDRLIATAPPAISGLIEARGVGLLNADALDAATVDLVVDLDHTEAARFPALHRITLQGQTLTLLHKVDSLHFPAMLMQYLKAGRQEPAWPTKTNPSRA